jgi:hypothetical protein
LPSSLAILTVDYPTYFMPGYRMSAYNPSDSEDSLVEWGEPTSDTAFYDEEYLAADTLISLKEFYEHTRLAFCSPELLIVASFHSSWIILWLVITACGPILHFCIVIASPAGSAAFAAIWRDLQAVNL